MGLLKRHDVSMVARIWTKAPSSPFKATAVYTSLDSGPVYVLRALSGRTRQPRVVHRRQPQQEPEGLPLNLHPEVQHRAENYERLVELPTFGHSDNHAGLQICDIVCSGLLYPIACYAYCTGHVNNVHVQSGASRLRRRYGQQLKELQHRYYDVEEGRHVGGVVVSDYLNQRSGT